MSPEVSARAPSPGRARSSRAGRSALACNNSREAYALIRLSLGERARARVVCIRVCARVVRLERVHGVRPAFRGRGLFLSGVLGRVPRSSPARLKSRMTSADAPATFSRTTFPRAEPLGHRTPLPLIALASRTPSPLFDTLGA